MKIILDTNVIIAAFAARGLCSAVYELCLDRFDVVLSEEILNETFTHLNDKIKLPPNSCKEIVSYLRANCTISEVDALDESVCRDKDDLHVLGLAQRSSVDCIVTGDKDLLDMIRYKDTRIVTPREFWRMAKELQPEEK